MYYSILQVLVTYLLCSLIQEIILYIESSWLIFCNGFSVIPLKKLIDLFYISE